MKTPTGDLHRRGFTLIELMIVVAIIGILAAIAVPSFISWTCKSRQREILTVFKAVRQGMIGYRQNDSEYYAGKIESFIGADFIKIGYVRSTGARYTISMQGDVLLPDKDNDELIAGTLNSCNAYGLPVLGVGNDDYTLHGCGNIDNDNTIDAWWGAYSVPPTNGQNDCDD